MMATRASRTSARAGSHGGGDSSMRGRRDYRPTPAHTLAISWFGFRCAKFIERPRSSRLDGLRRAGDDGDGAVGLHFVTADFDARLARLLSHAGERRSARLAWSRPLLLRPQFILPAA